MFRFGDPGGRLYGALGTSNANFLQLWSYVGDTTLSLVSPGRSGTGTCLRSTRSWAASNATIRKIIDNQPTWGTAFAFRPNGIQAISLVGFWDANATNQVDMRISADGYLYVTRNGTTLGTTATPLINTNAWHHIEFKSTIHPSAGTAQLWVNGTIRLNLSGVNTRATSNSYANTVVYGGTGQSYDAQWDFDDIIIYDGQATDANGFTDITGPIGDCGLSWLRPSGAGTTTQFTPSTGSNYAQVADTTVDGDTSYVESSTVGNVDSYATTDLPGTITTVKSVALVHCARKTDIGSRGLKALVRSGGGNTSHATEIALSDSYLYSFSNFGQDPNNGSPQGWTSTIVNNLEIGHTVSS